MTNRKVTTTNEFVESVRARRRAAGQADHITDPGVYRILDGIMATRRAANADC